jgi:hypothetical protein
MAGKIDQIVIVTLKKDTKYLKAGTHAMNVKVAEKLKEQKADFTQKPAKEVMADLVAKAKKRISDSEEAQEKANKGK